MAEIRTALRSEDGTVAIMAGLMLTATLGFAAVTVDVGLLYSQRRALQSATDAAAMAATQTLPTAMTTACRLYGAERVFRKPDHQG